jgi:hypothetical protein
MAFSPCRLVEQTIDYKQRATDEGSGKFMVCTGGVRAVFPPRNIFSTRGEVIWRSGHTCRTEAVLGFGSKTELDCGSAWIATARFPDGSTSTRGKWRGHGCSALACANSGSVGVDQIREVAVGGEMRQRAGKAGRPAESLT